MGESKDTTVEAVLEHLIEHGPSDLATVFARAFELAMQIERERFLGAGVVSRMLWKLPGGGLRACEGSVSQAARSRGIGSRG